MAAQSTTLELEAEHAARMKVGICEQEVGEEQRRLHDEMVAVELRERTRNLHQEFAREGSRGRERSRGDENARFYEAFLERLQQMLVAVHQRARDDQERLARELRGRGCLLQG